MEWSNSGQATPTFPDAINHTSIYKRSSRPNDAPIPPQISTLRQHAMGASPAGCSHPTPPTAPTRPRPRPSAPTSQRSVARISRQRPKNTRNRFNRRRTSKSCTLPTSRSRNYDACNRRLRERTGEMGIRPRPPSTPKHANHATITKCSSQSSMARRGTCVSGRIAGECTLP